jgi:hypothetical protein
MESSHPGITGIVRRTLSRIGRFAPMGTNPQQLHFYYGESTIKFLLAKKVRM